MQSTLLASSEEAKEDSAMESQEALDEVRARAAVTAPLVDAPAAAVVTDPLSSATATRASSAATLNLPLNPPVMIGRGCSDFLQAIAQV